MKILYINCKNILILVLYKILKKAKFDKNVIMWYNKEVVFKKKEYDKNMINLKSRNVLKKLIYVVTISMAVIGVLFIPQIIFSRVKLSKTVQENQSIESVKTDLASEENLVASKKTVSRSSTDIRTKSEEQNKKEVSKTEKQDNKKTENKEVKKEEKTENKETKKTNTKKSTSKKTESKKATDNKKAETTNKEKKDSEKDTEKTTEKKDSSKKETTTNKENKKSTTKTVSISQVKISKSMNLTKRTGLSRKDFIKLMSGVRADTSGFFEKNAGKIYDLCEKYSINEIFFCGLISAESGWNIASNHRKTHNYISLMRNGKLISYGSVNEGLEVAAQKLHYNYLTPGGKFYHGKTLAGVKTCFCPSSSWVGLVYGRMQQIL